MIDALTRAALSAAIITPPARRHQLFALLPKDNFKGPVLYFNLGRFFTTDTATESFEAIAKATKTDPVALAEIMAADESFQPLSNHLVRLLAARQAAALNAGQDVTQYAAAITGISTAPACPDRGAGRGSLLISATDMVAQPVEIMPLLGRVIERGCTGQIFGPSGSAKTFVVLDMALAVGTGGTWNGNLCEQGIVLYFAGEGHAGLKRRIKAWYNHNGHPDLSGVYVSRSTISFEPAGVQAVVEEVRALELQTSGKVALVVIDTLARHIEGDENSTRDMTGFISIVDGLRDAFPGSTAIIIHHTGNSAEQADRSRGSSALKAACDFEIKCDKGLLTFTKVKDGEQPEPMEFKLVPVKIGEDANGVGIASCIVAYGERSEKYREVVLTAGERELLELVKAHPGILSGDLKTALFDKRKEKDPCAKYDTLKKAFNRALDGLIEKKEVFMDGAMVKEGQGTKEGHLDRMSPHTIGTDRDTPFKGCPDVPICPDLEEPLLFKSDFVPWADQDTAA